MKRASTAILLTILGFSFMATVLPTSSLFSASVTDTIQVSLNVEGCNSNSVCEAARGETVDNCPSDCKGGAGPCIGCTLPTSFSIVSLSDSVATTSATIYWSTNMSAASTITWGRTTSYELGSLSFPGPDTAFSSLLLGLDPETTYYYKITANQTPGSGLDIETRTFTTIRAVAPVPSPLPFTAVYDADSDRIQLNWDNPIFPLFDSVLIVERLGRFPVDVNDGTIIYSGSAEEHFDYDIAPSTTYYYAAFVRATDGRYSAPSVDSARTPDVDDDVEPVEPVEPIDPFASIPNSITPIVPGTTDISFRFVQLNVLRGEMPLNPSITVNSSDYLTIEVDYDDFPETLKTIGVTLQHPSDSTQVFSFLLSVDPEKSAYSATIGPLIDPGTYKVFIHVLSHMDRRLLRLNGSLVVGAAPVGLSPLSVIERTTPIITAIGVTAGLLRIVSFARGAKSLQDIYLLILRALGALSGLFGFSKRKKPWGTVYDSMTKKPLDPAYVTVVGPDGEEKADAITDLDGRYSFFLPGGRYRIESKKSHYIFPSKVLRGRTSDELYNNLYFGEDFLSEEGEVVTKDIPMDPVGFDWNEFEKRRHAIYALHGRKETVKHLALNGLYSLGFIFSILAAVLTPTVLNISVLAAFVLLYVFTKFWEVRHHARRVVDAREAQEEPLSFAIVRAYLSNLNQEVKRAVADEFGRFHMLLQPGSYYLTVESRASSGKYEVVHKSENKTLKKGVLGRDIIIDETNL